MLMNSQLSQSYLNNQLKITQFIIRCNRSVWSDHKFIINFGTEIHVISWLKKKNRENRDINNEDGIRVNYVHKNIKEHFYVCV